MFCLGQARGLFDASPAIIFSYKIFNTSGSYLQSRSSSNLFIHTSSISFPYTVSFPPNPKSISTLAHLQLPISPCQSMNLSLVSRQRGSGKANQDPIFPVIMQTNNVLPKLLFRVTTILESTCYAQTSPTAPTPDTTRILITRTNGLLH